MSKLISGSAGTVLNVPTGAPVPHVTKWMFEPSVTVNKWNSNTSGGTKDANCGPADSKIKIELKLDICEETDGTFTGDGVPYGVGDFLDLSLIAHTSAPADRILVSGIVVTAPIEVDIDNGTPVSIAYELEGRGAWTGEGRFANV